MKAGFIAKASLLLLFGCILRAETANYEDTLRKANAEYETRLMQASEELNRTRTEITDKKAPLLKALRKAEDRISAAEAELTRMETTQGKQVDNLRRLSKELEVVRKNGSYMDTQIQDSLKAVKDGGLAPGEAQTELNRLNQLQRRYEQQAGVFDAALAGESVTTLFDRVQHSIGGNSMASRAMVAETKEILEGRVAFVGPETFFLSADGKTAGILRSKDGAELPLLYPVETWKTADAAALMKGELGTIPADSSGGKALKLRETTGTVYEHIRKGGLVAYAIVCVGLLSLVMILHKLKDLRQLRLDTPEGLEPVLTKMAKGDALGAAQVLGNLSVPVQELFKVGLKHWEEPKEILEDRLHSELIRQRLHFERRLPLLAVIATAAPLMGLLGTVVGMVKTFALITVFGTGNASKLASGISEVLVATELGLMVAIPTLIAHGVLAHRIQKNLGTLERYATEFVISAETAKRGVKAPREEVLA